MRLPREFLNRLAVRLPGVFIHLGINTAGVLPQGTFGRIVFFEKLLPTHFLEKAQSLDCLLDSPRGLISAWNPGPIPILPMITK
jgi:hypothetical protein